jgi:hypothetical protein
VVDGRLLIRAESHRWRVVADGGPDSFTEPLSLTDGLYSVVTVFATVRFGGHLAGHRRRVGLPDSA